MLYAKGNKNHEFVDEAFQALAKIRGKQVVEYLCAENALRAYNQFLIQVAAAKALGVIADPRATDALLEVIRFPRSKIEVVGACCQAVALVNPKDPKVIEAVMGQDRKSTRLNSSH